MMMTASATASPAQNMTSARRERRHHRSASGSTFAFSDASLGAFSPLTNLPRRARSVADVSTPASTPRAASTSPSRTKKASFIVGSSSEDEDEDCPLVREVNQRARMTKLNDEHFGDFSFDAEAHKAKTAHLDESETETEANFPPTPVNDAPPTPKLSISTDVTPAPVPFPALSPSPTRSAAPLPPLMIPDARLTTSPVTRSASSPFLTSPVAPKPAPRLTPASSIASTPYSSGTSTPVLLKNGRPLKPSLKSRVSLSMSSPDVSSMLAQAKSAPSTPRVHFPTRERLESVVLFDKRARPLEVASGDSPLASPRGFFAEMDSTSGLRMRNQSSFPFPNMSPRGSPLGSTTNLQGLSAAVMAKTKLKIAVSRSAPLQPTPRPDAHVHLAAVRLLGTRMSGSVLVKNISFSKRVALRYTFDNWETTSEVAGMWSSPNALQDLPSSGSDNKPKPLGSEETEIDVARGILVPAPNGWDRFVFNIKLDDVAPYLSKRPMLLAAKFEVPGMGEWWDNCNGVNYRFEFDHVPKTEPKAESPAPTPTIVGRPRSNTSPAPLNTDATLTDLPSATLLSAKLNSVVEKQAPVEEDKPARPSLKLEFPSDETITSAGMTVDLGAEFVAPAPKIAPVEKKIPLTITPPDSNASSPREAPATLPVPAPISAPVVNLPSPAESPASRKQPSPLPSPSAIEAPAHSTTNIKDQSYADFLAKYCFAGGAGSAPAAPAPSRPASSGFGAPSTGFGASTGFGPSNSYGTSLSGNSWGSPRPNFGWGATGNTAPAQNSWGGVGFSYGHSANSYAGGDL